MNWTTETIFQALGATVPAGYPRFAINAVQLDPDECSPGSLFVPCSYQLSRLKRWHSEEAAIESAFNRGASAALTNLARVDFSGSVPVIRVASATGSAAEPTVGALVAMARFARSAFCGKVIAVTGSVGKTTTKDMIHHAIAPHRRSFKTAGNRNSIAGICQTIVNLPADSQFCVVEVGATQSGHLRHAAIARPNIGIVTNVGLSHLENYGSGEDILREKISLFDHLEGERIGFLHSSVVEADNARESLISRKNLSRVITVGSRPGNDIHVTDLNFDGISTEGTMSIFGRLHRFRLPLPGRHFVDSAMFAAGVGSVSGVDVESVLAALATATPASRRCERFKVVLPAGAIELIDDSFNASPASVAALLDTLGQRTARRKVFVFGDMLELGAHAESLHREMSPLIDRAGIDLLITVGRYSEFADGSMPDSSTWHFPDATAASRAVPGLLEPLDLVAVKGSNAVGLDKVVAAIFEAGDGVPAGSWRIESDAAL